jgi:hypothetical protein
MEQYPSKSSSSTLGGGRRSDRHDHLDDGSSELRPGKTTGPSASKNLKHSQASRDHGHGNGHNATLDGDCDADSDSFVDESERLYMTRILEGDPENDMTLTRHDRIVSFVESQSQGTLFMDEHGNESHQRQRSYSSHFARESQSDDFTFTHGQTNSNGRSTTNVYPSNRSDHDPGPLALPEEDNHNHGGTGKDTNKGTGLLLEESSFDTYVDSIGESLASGKRCSLENTDTLIKARRVVHRNSANRNIYHDQKEQEQEEEQEPAVAVDSPNATQGNSNNSAALTDSKAEISHLKQVLWICRDENEDLLQDGQELFDENEHLTNQVEHLTDQAALANKNMEALNKKIEALEYDLEAAQVALQHGKQHQHTSSSGGSSENLASSSGPLSRSNHGSGSVSSRMSSAMFNAIPAMSRRRSSQDGLASSYHGTYMGSGSGRRRNSQDHVGSSNSGSGTYMGSGSGRRRSSQDAAAISANIGTGAYMGSGYGHGQLQLAKNSTCGAGGGGGGGGHSHVHTGRRHSTLDTVTWSKDDCKMAYEHSQRELVRQQKLFQQELQKSSDSHTHHNTELELLQDVTHFAVQQKKMLVIDKKKCEKIIKACTNCKPMYTQLLQQQQLDDQERKNALLLKQTMQESKTAVPYSSQQHQQAKLKAQQQLLSSTTATAAVRQQRRESSNNNANTGGDGGAGGGASSMVGGHYRGPGVTATGLFGNMANVGNTNNIKELTYSAHQHYDDEPTQCTTEPNGGGGGALRMRARRMSTFSLAKTAEKKEETNAPSTSSTDGRSPRNGLPLELLQELQALDNSDDNQDGDVETNVNEKYSKISGSSATSNDKKSNNAGTSTKRDSDKPSSTNQRGPRGGLDYKLLQELQEVAAVAGYDEDNSDTEEPGEKKEKDRYGNTGTRTQHVLHVPQSVLKENKDKDEADADEASNYEKYLDVPVSSPAAASENVNANVSVRGSTKLGLPEVPCEVIDPYANTSSVTGTGTAGRNQSLVSAMAYALMTVRRQSPPPHDTKWNRNQNPKMATAATSSEPRRRPHQLGTADRRSDSLRSNLLRNQVLEKRRSKRSMISSTNDSADPTPATPGTGNSKTTSYCHDNDSTSHTPANEEPIVIASGGLNIDKNQVNDDDVAPTTPFTAATTTGEPQQRDNKEGGMLVVLPRRATSTGDDLGDGGTGDGININIPNADDAILVDLTVHTTRRGLQSGLGLANPFRRRGGGRSAPSAAAI